MSELVEQHSVEIAEACRSHGVRTLEVFGSVAAGEYVPGQSDIDLLVEFVPMSPHARVDAYFSLRDDLERILGAPVDLVVKGAVKNAVIAQEIERTKLELYAA